MRGLPPLSATADKLGWPRPRRSWGDGWPTLDYSLLGSSKERVPRSGRVAHSFPLWSSDSEKLGAPSSPGCEGGIRGCLEHRFGFCFMRYEAIIASNSPSLKWNKSVKRRQHQADQGSRDPTLANPATWGTLYLEV